MSTSDEYSTHFSTIDGSTVAIDAGLRDHMFRIYNYMAAGVGLTVLVGWPTYQLANSALLQNPLMWLFIFAPLALVFFINARITSLPATTARDFHNSGFHASGFWRGGWRGSGWRGHGWGWPGPAVGALGVGFRKFGLAGAGARYA